MTREEYLRYVGSLQQMAYVRQYIAEEGRAAHMRCVEVKNDAMRFLVLGDKALDIGQLEYRGRTISFTSKPGLNGRNSFDTNGLEAQRSIMGGLFFTCGFENICAPCEIAGKQYPMHGRIRTTPAEHLCADAFWENGQYVLQVSGEMREAELFGENLMLRRTIRTVLGSTKITIRDEITNDTPQAAPMMLMYHCNFGFPFLSEGAQLILPSRSVTPRDPMSDETLAAWSRVGAPADGVQEEVFIHELAADADGNTFAAIENAAKDLAVVIRFPQRHLPCFMEWKSPASGDYVVGMEPSNSLVYGREYYEQRGDLHMLAPFASETVEWSFELLEGAAIEDLRAQCSALLTK